MNTHTKTGTGSWIWTIFVGLLIFGFLSIPEISDYFKNRHTSNTSDLKQKALAQFSPYDLGKMDALSREKTIESITSDTGWSYTEDSDRDPITFSSTGNTDFPYTINYNIILQDKQTKELIGYEALYIYTNFDWVSISENTYGYKGEKMDTLSSTNFLKQ